MAIDWEQALGSVGMMLAAMDNPQQALLMGQGMANRNQMIAARKRREEEQAAKAQQQQIENQLAASKLAQSQQESAQWNSIAAQYGVPMPGVPMPGGGMPGVPVPGPTPGLAATYPAAPQPRALDVTAIGPDGPIPIAPDQQLAPSFRDSLPEDRRALFDLGMHLKSAALLKAATETPKRETILQEGIHRYTDTGERVIDSPNVLSLSEAKEARDYYSALYSGTRDPVTGRFNLDEKQAKLVARAEQIHVAYIKGGASRSDAVAATRYEQNIEGASIEDVSDHVRKLVETRMARKAAGEDLEAADAAGDTGGFWSNFGKKLEGLNPIKRETD